MIKYISPHYKGTFKDELPKYLYDRALNMCKDIGGLHESGDYYFEVCTTSLPRKTSEEVLGIIHKNYNQP
ncbi:MAG: hypothetical protein ACYDCN_03600 [Bacteroidia bacterium]